MQPLQIPYMKTGRDFTQHNRPFLGTADLESYAISSVICDDGKDKPKVNFTIAHSGTAILLNYYVEEKSVQAKYREINDPVYKDSCVEFFIAFNDDTSYYNLEFNCMGTCLAGFGNDRENRLLLSKDKVKAIKTNAQLKKIQDQDLIAWELNLFIPISVFCHNNFTSLEGENCKVNFYKCGDDLPEPHFMAWKNVITKTPNFHLPEFFGEGYFQPQLNLNQQ